MVRHARWTTDPALRWQGESSRRGHRQSNDEEECTSVRQLRASGLRRGGAGTCHGGKHDHLLPTGLPHGRCRDGSRPRWERPAAGADLGCHQRSFDRLAFRSHQDAVGAATALDRRQRTSLLSLLHDVLARAGICRAGRAMEQLRLLPDGGGSLQRLFDSAGAASRFSHRRTQPRLR